MLKRNQVFVRAQDVLDLDDESFRVFVIGWLFRVGILTGIKDEYVEGESIKLRTKPGIRFPREDD